ncbi:hypothetical protein [Hymenobacter chitinivorans]|uniref:hypothetical protein n=1 Tax=Hymenobacter chitinivorans TaxID=89969 RepID=UPI000C249A02|nr:hypothetical protein [Hymenobacter chitinivorans]
MPATPIVAESVSGARRLVPKASWPKLSPAEFDKWAAAYLRENRTAPRETRLELIKWRHQYQLQQEAAEQKANPIPEEELRLIAERFARKAQSGFSPDKLPELTVEEQAPESSRVKLQRRKPKP